MDKSLFVRSTYKGVVTTRYKGVVRLKLYFQSLKLPNNNGLWPSDLACDLTKFNKRLTGTKI